MENKNGVDEVLWKIAQKRAKFKKSAFVYVVVNIFLWCIYFFTNQYERNTGPLPWPAWASLGWGLGLVFQYFEAYQKEGGTLENKEYEKLKKEQDKIDKI